MWNGNFQLSVSYLVPHRTRAINTLDSLTSLRLGSKFKRTTLKLVSNSKPSQQLKKQFQKDPSSELILNLTYARSRTCFRAKNWAINDQNRKFSIFCWNPYLDTISPFCYFAIVDGRITPTNDNISLLLHLQNIFNPVAMGTAIRMGLWSFVTKSDRTDWAWIRSCRQY